MNNTINYDAFYLAYAKGKNKKWTLESLIIDTLYKTTDENVQYIKTSNINCFGKPDEENENELIYKYGYLYRVPKTEVDLIVNKKDGKLQLKKVGVGFGYDDVETMIFKDIYKQIKAKNIYFQSNINEEVYLIK